MIDIYTPSPEFKEAQQASYHLPCGCGQKMEYLFCDLGDTILTHSDLLMA